MGYALEAELTIAQKFAILSLAELKGLAIGEVQRLRHELAKQENAVGEIDGQLSAVWGEIVRVHNLHPQTPLDAYKLDAKGTRMMLVRPALLPKAGGEPDGGPEGDPAPSETA